MAEVISRTGRHQEIARRAGLAYVTDAEPGLSRCRCGQGFRVYDPEGAAVSAEERKRVRDLVIPPAWTEVWICRDPAGHLQATGRDARRRKQYRYHDRWATAVRYWKFSSLLDFGHALTVIRAETDSDLRRRSPELQRSSALAVHLIDRTGARVGNREYTRDNQTHGLTTLRKQHASVGATYVRLRYTGKSHIERELHVRSRRIARHVRRLKSSPSKQLLVYREGSHWRDLTSDHVNEYLRGSAGEVATAKRFRTWRGTLIAFRRMARALDDGEKADHACRSAVRAAADDLGNTAAVCREHYIHPAVLAMTPEQARKHAVGGSVEQQLLDLLSST